MFFSCRDICWDYDKFVRQKLVMAQLHGNYSNQTLFLLPVLSAVLWTIAWPANGFAPFLLVSWLPILFFEEVCATDGTRRSRKFLFFGAYFGFIVFNLLTTWWVKHASFFGAVAAVFCNSLFMALVFLLFHEVKRRKGSTIGYLSLVTFWIAFEHLHMDWDLSWPWLTMGNGLAGMPILAQWYEFTGVLGGSFWILTTNILLLHVMYSLIAFSQRYLLRRRLILAVISMVIPVAISVFIYYSYSEKSDPIDVVVVQPNVDPYNEKFSGLSERQQLQRILNLSDSVIALDTSARVDFLVAPETALPSGMWEEDLQMHPQTGIIRDYITNRKLGAVVIGAATNRLYPDSNQRSFTARKFSDAELYYDSYNTALMYGCDTNIQIHHKSKLVPGVEKMPFPAIFKYIEDFAIDLGGITGSLGVQEYPSVFHDTCIDRKVAPVICYESIYGDYLSQYVRSGAGLIFIITNDGWWDDTPGHRQHQAYARLRAIEFRRSIARSANTGISCFIDQRGDVQQPTGWWVPKAIRAKINYNRDLTIYAKHGDYLGIICLGVSALVMLMAFVPFSKKRKTELHETT